MIVDLVIVSLSLGFAVISWVISSQAYDDKPVSNPVKSIEASKEATSSDIYSEDDYDFEIIDSFIKAAAVFK